MFKDFLLDYQIEKNKISNYFSIKQLPTHQKVLAILFLVFTALANYFSFSNNDWGALFSAVTCLLLYGILCYTIQRPKNQKYLRENFYSIYNQKKIMILEGLLKKYNINTDEKIDFIINQARKNYQKSSRKTFSSSIAPVISPFITPILSGISQLNPNVIYLFLLLFLLLLIYSFYKFFIFVLDLFSVNKSIYEEIIEGLEYIKAFDKA